MMQREACILITFPTTTAAFAMEKAAAWAGEHGRLVPLPAAVKAGCGLGWSAPVSERERLTQFLQKQKLSYIQIREAVL